jgi:hypothetical protein
MRFRLQVDISLVITFVILINFGLINVLANDISRTYGFVAVTIIAASSVDDVLVLNEYYVHHNHTSQLPFSKYQTRLIKW